MARLNTRTISRRTVEALEVERDTVFWDSELMGFGVRVYPSGRKYYVAQTRAGGAAAKRVTVGRHGVISAEEARRRAALVIARIKAGEEPTPDRMARRLANGPTVAALAARYLEEHVMVRCKPRSVVLYRLAVEKHILPEFGQRSALGVGQPSRQTPPAATPNAAGQGRGAQAPGGCAGQRRIGSGAMRGRSAGNRVWPERHRPGQPAGDVASRARKAAVFRRPRSTRWRGRCRYPASRPGPDPRRAHRGAGECAQWPLVRSSLRPGNAVRIAERRRIVRSAGTTPPVWKGRARSNSTGCSL